MVLKTRIDMANGGSLDMILCCVFLRFGFSGKSDSTLSLKETEWIIFASTMLALVAPL